MIESTILHLLQNEMQIVRSFAPKGDHATKKAGEMVSEFIRDFDTVKSLYSGAWERMWDDGLEDDQETGHVLVRILEGQQCVFEFLSQEVETVGAEKLGGQAEKFVATGAAINNMLDDLQREWPWIDQESARDAKKAVESGKYYTAKDALDELRCADSPAHQTTDS